MTTNEFECVICFEQYDSKERKPCIGSCGHPICEQCKLRLSDHNCPQCKKPNALSSTTFDYELLEIMKINGLSTGISSEKDHDFQNKMTIPKGECSECGASCKNLCSCITCGIIDKIFIRHENQKLTLDLDGYTIGEGLKRVKSNAICDDCAIEEHNDHEILYFSALFDDAGLCLKSRIKEMTKTTKTLMDCYYGAFRNAYKVIKQQFIMSSVLSPIDQELNFIDVELNLHELAQINKIVEKTIDKLKIVTDNSLSKIKKIENNHEVQVRVSTGIAKPKPVLFADFKQSNEDPLIIGSYDQTMWSTIGKLPYSKTNYAIASNESSLYVIGGILDGKSLDDVKMFDKAKNICRNCDPLKRSRSRSSATFHKGKIYVCGGYDGSFLKSVEIYDPITKQWQDGPDMNGRRADCAVVSTGDNLYVLGGVNKNGYERNIESLHETESKFIVIDKMQGRFGLGACAVGGRIYVAGGSSETSITRKDCHSYDPISQTWREEVSMIRARKCFGLHFSSDNVYAIRGYDEDLCLIKEIERYDIKAKVWTAIPYVKSTSQQSANHD